MAPWSILFDAKERDLVARIQAFIDGYKKRPDYEGFDGPLMKAIKIESASVTQNSKTSTPTAKTTFSILVTPNLQNPRGAMHGGAQALLVDMCTTMAIAPLSTEVFWNFGGLTRTLNVTCLKPAPGGEVVYIDCEVRGIGKRLAHITCTLRNADGDVLALGDHGKAAIPIGQVGSGSKI
ncbi:HotDog domain-containing protein [Cadophora sp. MPI-SDFR-AT-0126]|nr:HotDog domain-containing protein [Leotiomycetes sp. MPI-SDFR-AT-0126]